MTTRRWIELRVPAGVEGVEAVSEILTRVGHQGIAVDLPVEPRGRPDDGERTTRPDHGSRLGTEGVARAWLVDPEVGERRDTIHGFRLGRPGERRTRSGARVERDPHHSVLH